MKKLPLSNGKYTLVDDDVFFKYFSFSLHENGNNYVCLRIDGTMKMFHRVIMNPGNGFVIDHIDHNKLNNQRENLRICTVRQNAFNSDYKGFYKEKDRNMYRSSIRIEGGKRIFLGRFSNKKDAKNAYQEARKIYHGEFAYEK